MTEGIGSLSMARVAGELGVATMSLYRYVAAKDDLLILMVDTGARARHRHTDETGLARGADGLGGGACARPTGVTRGRCGSRSARPPLGPNNVAYLESALRQPGRHRAVRAAEAVERCCC